MARCNKPVRTVTAQQAQRIIENTRDKPVYVRFFAHWCDSCKESKPEAEEASNEACSSAEVLAVDGDNPFNSKWADDQGVKAFPTVVAYLNGRKAGELDNGFEKKSFAEYHNKFASKLFGFVTLED